MQLRDFCFDVVNEETGIFHKILGDNFQHQIDTLHKLTIAAFPGEDFGNVSSKVSYYGVAMLFVTCLICNCSIYHRKVFDVYSH